jgi:3-oxoacyl-[acyl-carrier protein] reductase
MLLENKVAVIYGGGAISRAVAEGFSREGARIFLAGRTQAKLDKIASDVRATGSTVDTAIVDALDEQAVNQYVDSVVAQAGKIDISFNLIGVGDVQEPLLEITLENFLQPITNTMRSHFITGRAAARHMIKQGSGVILAFGGGGPQTQPGLGGFKISLDALEGLRRQWALELGEHGIRVVTLKTGGILDSITDPALRAQIAPAIEAATLLKRTATFEDVGNVAAFVASDYARTITSTEINISCGAIVDG